VPTINRFAVWPSTLLIQRLKHFFLERPISAAAHSGKKYTAFANRQNSQLTNTTTGLRNRAHNVRGTACGTFVEKGLSAGASERALDQ